MNEAVVQYWVEYYATDHCTLCGNSGVIDTRDAHTAAGLQVGRRNWCICPNGQNLRKQMGGLPNDEESRPIQTH